MILFQGFDFCWFRKSDRVNTLKMNTHTHKNLIVAWKSQGVRKCWLCLQGSIAPAEMYNDWL